MQKPTLNIDNLKISGNIHFIGIGGISMSGLALTLSKQGFSVSGSDISSSDTMYQLKNNGIHVYTSHEACNIPSSTELVVHTVAISPNNSEILFAKEQGLKIIDRSKLMGSIMEKFKKPICVSGTHGKTTTTSMISEIFIKSNANPSINLGGILPSISSNYRNGDNKFFIAESCEYFDSFLNFKPHTSIVLNIETDHLDYFKNLEHIESSFAKFVSNTNPDGCVIINSSINNYKKIVKNCKARVVTFGTTDSNYFAKNITFDSQGFPKFNFIINNVDQGVVHLNVCGHHNVLNATASIACSVENGFTFSQALESIEAYVGVKRRFEYKGTTQSGLKIVDDYAHHPTEISATLIASKNTSFNKLYCLFQPHTFSRTKTFLTEIAKSLILADVILVLDIYAAREQDTGEIHSTQIVDEIKKLGGNACYFSSFDEAQDFIAKNTINNDLLITMGAGDVYKLGGALLTDDLSMPISSTA